MSEPKPTYTVTPTQLTDEPDPLAMLPKHKRDTLLGMDQTNFARSRKMHILVLLWDGTRVTVLDMEQTPG